MIKAVLRAASCGALALMSFAAPAFADTPSAPFEVTGTLQEIPGPSARCASHFGGTILGGGDSAVLGKVVFIATDCITPNGSLYTFSDGRFIITTTSGEQVYASYSGQFVPSGVGTRYVFSNASFQITGGTGKYAKASGGGSLTGGEDMTTYQGTVKLSGQILFKDR
jgi:hypothetical protein